MSKKINYDGWSKEELVNELRRIKDIRYGLVWHRDLTKETIDILVNPDATVPSEMFPNEMKGKPFPVLKEDKSKEIITDKSKPVNLLIEGDNYHSLAVLSFTHNNSIDVIYIDPPYNTGNKDFKYNDQWIDKEDSYRHSKWLSFMEKRLKLAKGLLSDKGIIFISIDDNEQAQLKLLCDEVFGDKNFIAIVPRLTKKGGKSSDDVSKNHDYVLIYKKTDKASLNKIEHTDSGFKYEDEYLKDRGLYKLNQTLDYDSIQYSSSLDYEINLEGETIIPGGVTREEMELRKKENPDRDFCWRWSKSLFEFGLKNGFVVLKKHENKPSRIYTKTYQNATISEDENGDYFVEIVPRSKSLSTIDLIENQYSNDSAKKELKMIFGKVLFDYPKPTELIKEIIRISSNPNSIILDFMAGTGTTGQAVLELNEEDKGNRRFILCTNNENNICEDICYPRLEKIINGYKNLKGKNIKGLTGNLKYYTCDFVEAEPTDKNKRKLVNESTEMLCIHENTFELVKDEKDFKIFKDNDRYLGIIFYEEAINDFKDSIRKINGHFNVYVFSLGDDPHEQQFIDVKDKVSLCAIPEVILKVYREVFK